MRLRGAAVAAVVEAADVEAVVQVEQAYLYATLNQHMSNASVRVEYVLDPLSLRKYRYIEIAILYIYTYTKY